MRKIDKIILHCSASDRDCDDNIETIDRWHRERGFTGVGYHFVITKDGNCHQGRALNVQKDFVISTMPGLCKLLTLMLNK